MQIYSKCHIPSIQKSKNLKIKPALIFWVRYEVTGLKTTAYNNLSRSLAEKAL